MKRALRCLLAVLGLTGCSGIPPGVEPLGDFDVERYLGTWHEIARPDHGFERGLGNVTARCATRPDGGIAVLNRGCDRAKGAWWEAGGTAYFLGGRDVGRLKVSFFGPFYGGYDVIALDRDGCSWSVVCGPKPGYLRILARRPAMDRGRLDELIGFAAARGFDTDGLIFVDHGPVEGGEPGDVASGPRRRRAA